MNKDNFPQIENYDNYSDYSRDIESYVNYNSDSSYDKCLEEIEQSNIEHNCRIEKEQRSKDV